MASRVYTRTGDKGETGLWGGARVPKNHHRVQACGEIDELNCALGAALASFPENRALKSLREPLVRIQNELFVIGTLLAAPPEKAASLPPPFGRGLPAPAASRLESEIDRLTSELRPLKSFILPGGSFPGSMLHLCRAVCRRAERRVVSLRQGGEAPEGVVAYLNRLSDFLFTAARWVNHKLKRREDPWTGLRAR